MQRHVAHFVSGLLVERADFWRAQPYQQGQVLVVLDHGGRSPTVALVRLGFQKEWHFLGLQSLWSFHVPEVPLMAWYVALGVLVKFEAYTYVCGYNSCCGCGEKENDIPSKGNSDL